MPLYEFECEKCGERKEVIQNYQDDPPEHCEQPMKRLLSGSRGLVFKGKGFYKTDYKDTKATKKP